MKEERAKGQERTTFYRDLEKERVQVERQADEEVRKLAAEAGKEEAENEQKMGELRLAALREFQQTSLSRAITSGSQRLQNALDISNQEFNIQRTAIQRELAALDKFAKDYENKKKAMNDKLAQLDVQQANQDQQLTDQAAATSHSRLSAAQTEMVGTYVSGFTQVMMGKESMAKALQQADSQVLSSMLKNALMSMATLDMTKEKDAAAAARKAYNIGLGIGGPAGIVLGPVFAAGAFAAEMAFADGGIVPGVGHGDTVPAMLTPGEGVVPGGVMDGLRKMAASGSMGGGPTNHVTVSPTYHIHAVDADGVDKLLQDHNDTIQKHVTNELRKLNR